jgi:hypothetical protein
MRKKASIRINASPSCELATGCPSGPDRGRWSCDTPNPPGARMNIRLTVHGREELLGGSSNVGDPPRRSAGAGAGGKDRGAERSQGHSPGDRAAEASAGQDPARTVRLSAFLRHRDPHGGEEGAQGRAPSGPLSLTASASGARSPAAASARTAGEACRN